jgi:hypothetical protein
VDQPVYHVVLEGRRVGPYDRRTIVGMRIKKALTSDHVLIAADGARMTVAELIGRDSLAAFQPNRSSLSGIRARYPAWLVHVRGRGVAIPRFKGEIEARVQGEVLRLAGRFRRGFGWKDDRVKIPLADVAHTRVTGSQVELWLRGSPSHKLQRVALELFTPPVAQELVTWLPAATPWPAPASAAAKPRKTTGTDPRSAFWISAIATISVAIVVTLVLIVLLYRRGR